MRRSFCLPLALFLMALAANLGRQTQAAVYNLHLVTDNGPDYTNLVSFVRSVTDAWERPQDKCIAIWRWGRRSRRQTSCALEDGRLIWDPILHYNSYGAMNCGVISALNVVSFLELGYQARYVQLSDHTVSEVSWDDGQTWHMFDSSMSFFCYNHAGEVASCQDIKEAHACELSGGKREPGHYYLYHGAAQCVSHRGTDGWRCAADQPVKYDRTLANGASSYTSGFSVGQYTQYARYGRRYSLNLLPYQTYTRYWRPLDRGHDVISEKKPNFYRPLGNRDPDDQHGLNNIRGNGVWVFEPDLRTTDCRNLLHDDHLIELRGTGDAGPNLRPAQPRQLAWAVFKVSAANVITSMRIQAVGRCSGDNHVLRILTSRSAGIQWTPVWQSRGGGTVNIQLGLRDEVAGVTECLVKVEMRAGGEKTAVGLDTIQLTTTTQLNRRTLPKLTLGTNHVRLMADEQVESTVLWPALHAGQYRQTVYETENVHSADEPDGFYKATLGSAANDRECFATWRLEVPTDITGVTYGVVATNRSPRSYVSLQHSFDGQHFGEFYRDADGGAPFDQQVLHTIDDSNVPAAARRTYLKCVFVNQGSGAATYNMAGIQDLLVRVEHQPRDNRFQPVEIAYNWTEHRQSGDVTRSHTQRVASLPHEYAVYTAGFRDPTMNWVRVNLEGYGPESRPTYGYSDGENVGAAFQHKTQVYHWGNNVAGAKPYTASRPSSTASGNADSDGRELTNGVIIASSDEAASDSVQAATAFWTAGDPVTFVVDLGRQPRLAGVRVSSHQVNAETCHPERVEVAVSDDGQTWQTAGTIRHNDLWHPPSDYEPWEHDDDPSYDHLPAGGRLAYTFPRAFEESISGRYVRFICFPLPEKGMGLSELEVFDQVRVSQWPKKAGGE